MGLVMAYCIINRAESESRKSLEDIDWAAVSDTFCEVVVSDGGVVGVADRAGSGAGHSEIMDLIGSSSSDAAERWVAREVTDASLAGDLAELLESTRRMDQRRMFI